MNRKRLAHPSIIILQNKIADTNKLDNRNTLSQINSGPAKFASKVQVNKKIVKSVKIKILIFYLSTKNPIFMTSSLY